MNTRCLAKIVGLILGLCVVTTTYADWKGNFYLGMASGYGARDGKADFRAAESVAPFGALTLNRNFSDNGYFWGFLGGYQIRCRKVLYGIDAKITWQDFNNRKGFHFTDTTTEHYSNFVEYERDEVWSLSARAGYQVNPWALVYFRFGVESADESVLFQTINVTRSTMLDLKGTRSIYRCLSGLGVEIPIWKQVTMRTEYNYSSRGKGATATGIMPVSLEVISADLKARQHSFILDFVWNFKPLA